MHYFTTRGPVTIPGSTALGTSTAVLRGLKTKGAAELRIVEASNSMNAADTSRHPNVYEFAEPYKLRRVGNGTVSVRVVVNDSAVALPAVQAQGDYIGDKAEFFFLDDERNPLSLAYRFDTGGGEGAESGGLRVVKISYRCSGSTASPSTERIERLERALRDQRRAIVYDLYFDFNSDVIREESQPTIRDIAEVLKRNPDWKLSIEGHTDAVASDSYNLTLSQRRAAAVRSELTAHFGIAASRLAATGFGESRPQDRNDSIEGRARNRRVELVRQ
jgi:outer membrane protein OmpA-like peptidoglycan-associated protein